MRRCGVRHSRRRPALEPLERRQLLAADVVINEFMAINNSTLADEDGEFSDWIELHNTTAAAVDLDGYYLTDDLNELTKWRLPDVTLPPGGYGIVFASDKDRVEPAGELHTNFQLSGNGEPLALVRPDGSTIEYAYEPAFPEQLLGVSYGLGTGVGVEETLVDEEAAARVLVPQDGSLGTTWTEPSFDASGWTEAELSVGYEKEVGGLYAPYLVSNLEEEMFGISASAYVRAEFEISDPESYRSLELNLRYDDGFVAYLNGVLFALRHAPPGADFDASATVDRPDEDAILVETLDLTRVVGELVSGTNVLAIHGLNASADSSRFLIGAELTGITTVTGTPQYFATPTPGEANLEGAVGIVGDTRFSVDRGFYEAPFEVEITTSTPGAEIRYTLDGSLPTATTGLLYQEPIEVSSTTLLRAAAFQPGYLSSNIDTQTYIFLEDVIRQDGSGLPPTAHWGHLGPDYQMDPEVVDDPRFADSMIDDMKSIPSLSLVTEWDNWFGGGGQGIYINGTGSPRPVSAEMLDPSGAEEFQINGSVQIQGGSSTNRWKVDKLSMRLKFTQEFGPTKLEYPLFGEGATDSFDTIILDAVLNYSWLHNFSPEQRENAKYIQDQYVADLQNAVGGAAPHGRYMHLYLNGLYWGMYYIHERPDQSFASDYLGGDKDDYDGIKHRSGTVINGTNANYQALLNATSRDLSDPANYAAVEELLDIDDFINYMLVNFYTGNTDWAHHNWYASFNRVDPAGRWRFHSWDAEHVLHRLNDNVTGKNDSTGPTRIHQQLRANPEYRLKFADYVQRHLFEDGVMTPENAAAAYQARMEQVDRAVVGESARWGDNRVSVPFTRDDWVETQQDLLSNYFPRRTAIVLSQLRAAGLYPTIEAPRFNQHGGQVDSGFELLMGAGQGTIYYTLDGSDPRLPGGAISPDAQAFESGTVSTPLVPAGAVWRYLDDGSDQGAAWRDPAFDDAAWSSGPAQLGYGDGGEDTVVSYGDNASNKHATTYFRHAFTVSDPAELDTVSLRLLRDDGAVVYLNGEELLRSNMPGGPVDFETFASSAVGGASESTFFDFGIDPAKLVPGENVLAVEIHQNSRTSSDISFDLELIASETTSTTPLTIDRSQLVRARAYSAGQWSALNEAEFLVNPASTDNLAITEIYYHPTQPTAEELAVNPDFNDEDFEYIELVNTSSDTVDLRGVRLTNGITFDFSDGEVHALEPGQVVLIVKSEQAFQSRFGTGMLIAGEFGGQISNGGEQLVLENRSGEVIADFEYSDESPWPSAADGSGASLTRISLDGEVGDSASWRADTPSPGATMLDVGQLPGDYNGNGRVEQADLDLVLLNWNESFESLPATWIHERPTSGIVDQAELDAVLLHWGTTLSGAHVAAAHSAAAEPAAVSESQHGTADARTAPLVVHDVFPEANRAVRSQVVESRLDTRQRATRRPPVRETPWVDERAANRIAPVDSANGSRNLGPASMRQLRARDFAFDALGEDAVPGLASRLDGTLRT